MAITNGYATLVELKERLAITDDGADSVLEAVIEAASRQIDSWCSRSFYSTTATRYLTAESVTDLFLDTDLISVTSLKTDVDGDRTYETTWATTDYDLEPDQAPYRRIYVAPLGDYLFPTQRRGIEIVGAWGYGATAPDAINEATLLLAALLWKRKDAPFGIAGNEAAGGELRTLPGMDPQIKGLVWPYRRLEIVPVW